MRKAFICPSKYVQGEDELFNLGYFVKTFGKKALLIADPFAYNLVKDKLDATAAKYGVEFYPCGDIEQCGPDGICRLAMQRSCIY